MKSKPPPTPDLPFLLSELPSLITDFSRYCTPHIRTVQPVSTFPKEFGSTPTRLRRRRVFVRHRTIYCGHNQRKEPEGL